MRVDEVTCVCHTQNNDRRKSNKKLIGHNDGSMTNEGKVFKQFMTSVMFSDQDDN